MKKPMPPVPSTSRTMPRIRIIEMPPPVLLFFPKIPPMEGREEEADSVDDDTLESMLSSSSQFWEERISVLSSDGAMATGFCALVVWPLLSFPLFFGGIYST